LQNKSEQNLPKNRYLNNFFLDLDNKDVESWMPGSIVKVFSKKSGSLDIGHTP
jgi:hypothetical protein